MTLSATVKAMADAGCTPQQIAAAVVAYEAAQQDAKADRRAKDAERQRRNRARVQNVTRTHADSDGQVPPPASPSSSPPITPLITTPSSTPSGGPALKRGTRPQLSADQTPSEAITIAAEAGLTAESAKRQWRRFANHLAAKGSTLRRWKPAWVNWVDEARETRQPKTAPIESATIFVTTDDPRWKSLAAEWRKEKGKPPPLVGDGWHFPNSMIPTTAN
jgi:hypothetical protein